MNPVSDLLIYTTFEIVNIKTKKTSKTLSNKVQSTRDTEDVANTAVSAVMRCKWTSNDEQAFVDFLIDYKTQAGDNGFKKATFSAAATYMATHSLLEALKTWIAYKNKFQKVHLHMYIIVYFFN